MLPTSLKCEDYTHQNRYFQNTDLIFVHVGFEYIFAEMFEDQTKSAATNSVLLFAVYISNIYIYGDYLVMT